MAYGVTPEGWNGKSFEVLQSELENRLRANLGPGFSLIPQSVLGVIAGIIVDMLSEVWTVAEGVWLAFDESAAEGVAQDNLAAITGTERLLATASSAAVVLTGVNGTVVAAGKVVSVQGAGTRFSLATGAVLATASAWAPSTVYAVGARVANGGNSYQAVVAGTSAGSGGPTGSTATQVDGTVTWRWLGTGAALAEVRAEAAETGPVPALANTLTIIETPVSGWQGVTNPADAELGRAEETAEELRIRRRVELRALGRASVDAIRGRLLDPELVPGARSAIVFENPTDTTNVDGMPPHSIEALVEGGEDADIREVVFSSKAAGIATYGTTSGTVVDASGVSHTVRHSRPTLVTIWISGQVVVNPTAPSEDAVALEAIEAAVLAYGASLQVGRDVRYEKVKGAVTALSYVEDVSNFLIGTSSPSGTANIVIGTRQRASFDSARITFTLVRLTQAQL